MDTDQTDTQPSKPADTVDAHPPKGSRLTSLRRRAMALWAIVGILLIYVLYWIFVPSPTAPPSRQMGQTTTDQFCCWVFFLAGGGFESTQTSFFFVFFFG